jgi:hypothetical protein
MASSHAVCSALDYREQRLGNRAAYKAGDCINKLA